MRKSRDYVQKRQRNWRLCAMNDRIFVLTVPKCSAGLSTAACPDDDDDSRDDEQDARKDLPGEGFVEHESTYPHRR